MLNKGFIEGLNKQHENYLATATIRKGDIRKGLLMLPIVLEAGNTIDSLKVRVNRALGRIPGIRKY
jgi:hypothetical protein